MEHSVKTTNAYVYEATLVTTVEQVCLNAFERQNILWYCILHDDITGCNYCSLFTLDNTDKETRYQGRYQHRSGYDQC